MQYNLSVDHMVSLIGRQSLVIDQLTIDSEQARIRCDELVKRLDAAVRILSCVALGTLKPCQIETDILAKTWRVIPVPDAIARKPDPSEFVCDSTPRQLAEVQEQSNGR